MTEKEYKYKRWGWGALIGLAAVIIIAGIIIGVSLSAPKPSAQVASTETTQTEDQKKADEETAKRAEEERKAQEEAAAKKRAEEEKKAQQNNNGKQTQQEIINQHINTGNSTIPKTGPEDSIVPVVGAALVAMLFAYNVVLFKKNA